MIINSLLMILCKLNLHLGLSHPGQSSSDLKENKNKNEEAQKKHSGKMKANFAFPKHTAGLFSF